MALRNQGSYYNEEREKKPSHSLGSTLILKKMLGLEQPEKEGRNNINRFYNTGDDESKGSGSKTNEDIRNKKIESKYVLPQNQVKLADEASRLPHSTQQDDQLKQSKPNLPKNANIAGNLLQTQFDGQKEPYVFPPDFQKKIKITQDQIKAPMFYSSLEDSPAGVSLNNYKDQAANESEECVVGRITSYSLNNSQKLKGKMFYQTQILNGKKAQDNQYQDNRIYENKPLRPIERKMKVSSHRNNDSNIYGERLENLNQSQDLGQSINILSGGATLKGLSKSNMSNYGPNQNSKATSGNPSLGRANNGKQFFIGNQRREQQQAQNNQIILRMQAQSQMSSYNVGKNSGNQVSQLQTGAQYQNKGNSQRKNYPNKYKEIELMNASAPLNISSLKQGASFDGQQQNFLKIQKSSQSIQNISKAPNNINIVNTMGTLNATDIYNINQHKVARSTQNQRKGMGRTDKNQIYLNMNLQQKNNDELIYYNKKASSKNQRINRPQSTQQMIKVPNNSNLNETQIKQMKHLQQLQQMQLNNSQVCLKQSSLYANDGDLLQLNNNRPKSMMNKAPAVPSKKTETKREVGKMSNSLENLRNQANNEYLIQKQRGSAMKPQKIKPPQKVTIMENEFDQPLTNLNLGNFEPDQPQRTIVQLKKNIKSVTKKIEKSESKRGTDTLQTTQKLHISGKGQNRLRVPEDDDELTLKIEENEEHATNMNVRLSKQQTSKNKKIYMRAQDMTYIQRKIEEESAELQKEVRQLMNQDPLANTNAAAQIRSRSSITDIQEKKALNLTQPAGVKALNTSNVSRDHPLDDQYLNIPHDEYHDFADQSDGYFKLTNMLGGLVQHQDMNMSQVIKNSINEFEETKNSMGYMNKNMDIELIKENVLSLRRSSDNGNNKDALNNLTGHVNYKNWQNILGQTIPITGHKDVFSNRYQNDLRPPQSQKSGGSQGQSQGKKKRSNSRQGYQLPSSQPKKPKMTPLSGQITQTNKAQMIQAKKKLIQIQNMPQNVAETLNQKKNSNGDIKMSIRQPTSQKQGNSAIKQLTVPNKAIVQPKNLLQPQNQNPQNPQKKFKISTTTKNNQGPIQNFIIANKKKEQNQMMNTLLNFYVSKQKELQPQKKMMTQKINVKEKMSTTSKQNTTVNDAYLKGLRNSSLNATSKSNKNKIQLNIRQKKVAEMRANSENKYSKGNHMNFLQQTQTNIGEQIQLANGNMSTQPISLQHTYQCLTQNLKNIHNRGHSGKISFLGTLKGGLGIMNNLSNGQDNSVNWNQLDTEAGQILNIDSVLNQLNQQNHETEDDDDEQFDNSSNEQEDQEDPEEQVEALWQQIPKEEDDIINIQQTSNQELYRVQKLKEDQNNTQPIPKQYIQGKQMYLDLKEGDGAGSMIPGIVGDDSTSSKGEAKRDKQKRIDYINKLQEDLDEKLKQRYAYANLQMHNQSNNNQILVGTDTSAQDNSSQGGRSSQGDNSNNRVHNYIFGKQIGEGAYAVVRIATSREDNQKYAIKIYDKNKLNDINRQRSVRREVVLLQKMNHEHVVKLIEAFETDSHVYLVMENVSGGSLHSYLKEMINKQLDEEEARRIFQQILIALKYCHSKCIAHRDIKLENILLDENKNVKLIDFGFSTCIPNHKKIRMFCGTPSYMAPQIVSKVEYAGPPADIWASGVLLYALLNGCFPFRGQTDDDLYRRIKRGTYQIQNQKVSREYLDILQRCLDINDDTRATAADLLDDQWFKIKDIKQRAYDEEKRQFKARILAKVPIIKKTNHTICILAGQPNHIQNSNADTSSKQGAGQTTESNNVANTGMGSVGSGSLVNSQRHTPEQNAAKLKKAGGLQGLTIINQNEKHILKVNHNEIGNFPYTNNQNPNKCELIISDYGLNSGMVIDKQNNDHSGGAILLSYGAAVAPHIQINNINNLNLINSNMKKKLNHEAYQAYYNTSSANNTNCGLQASPMAGAGNTGPTQQQAVSQSNVYGQPQHYDSPQQQVHQQVQQPEPLTLDSGKNSIPSNSQVGAELPQLRQLRSGGASSQDNIASDQSSPYGSAYHHNLVNNQMAQLQQLQQEVIQEKRQKEMANNR